MPHSLATQTAYRLTPRPTRVTRLSRLCRRRLLYQSTWFMVIASTSAVARSGPVRNGEPGAMASFLSRP